MRNLLVFLLAGSLFGLVGCDKKDDSKPADGKAKTGDTAKKALEAAKKNVKGADDLADKAKTAAALVKGDKKGISIEEYERLMLGLAKCEVTDRGIDRKCEQWKAFDEGRKNRGTIMKSMGGQLAGLGRKHIKHASPAVRLQAASLMGSVFGASKDSQSAIIRAAQAEKHPRVLKQLIRSVGSSIAKNGDVLKLVMANADHENAKVRMEAVNWLTSSWAKKTEGTLEKAIEMVKKDASPDVRQYACRRLGERADERALPVLKELTKKDAADKDPKLYSACMKGLVGMWSSPVVHETPSEKAYKLTLKRLSATPRTENRPSWTTFSGMTWAKKEKFQKKATWFKKDKLVGVLADIVKDRSTHWMARTGAVDTMKDLGAKKAVFEKLQKGYESSKDKPGSDAHVYKKLGKVLAGK